MKMIQKAALIALTLLLTVTVAQAAIRNSAASGSWSSTSTWVGSTIPQANDTVIINPGHTISVDGNYPSTNTSFRGVTVAGTLVFDNGAKLNIVESGYFELMFGGWLLGGTTGSRIQFVTLTNNSVYQIMGPFNLTGPMYATGGTGGFVGGALPVQWLSYSAEAEGNQVKVSWSTAQEINTALFVVESSVNGQEWKQEGTVAAAGNSDAVKAYSHTVSGLGAGVVYFRIKQIDLNGMYEYTDMFQAEVKADLSVTVYPNPTVEVLNIKTDAEGEVKVEVRNAYGQLVKEATSAEKQIKLEVSELPSGLYHVQVSYGLQVIEKKIVKQ